MKVFAELTEVAATASRQELREVVARLEDAGADGVGVSDHLFTTTDGRPRRDGTTPGCDPLTTLAAVAGMSGRLELQTVVMNTAWIHPALLLRQFGQLAVLIGGERVTAGLGAGWSTEEFAALGQELPPFRARMDRLEEVLRLARTLYDEGTVTLEGRSVVARDLPARARARHPAATARGRRIRPGAGHGGPLRRRPGPARRPPTRASGRRNDGRSRRS